MTAPSPLYLACRELIEAVDRRKASGSAMLDRRSREKHATLEQSEATPEHGAWKQAISDEMAAQDKIRALLAGDEP